MNETNSPKDPNANHPTNEDHHNQPIQGTSHTLASTLLTKCNTLLSDLDTFQSLLAQTLRNPQLVEVRSLRSSIVSELRTLEKLSRKIQDAVAAAGASVTGDAGSGTDAVNDEIEAKYVHALRSSNLPFYEALWAIARGSCTGLAAFGKRFYWEGIDGGRGLDGEDNYGTDMDADADADTSEKQKGKKEKKKLPNKDKRKSVLVDIVADDGGEWVKVSTISESRLLFEMAEKGWEKDSDAEEGETKDRTVLRNYEDDDEDDDEVGLIKLASDMRRASNAMRVRYRHPRIRFVIPRIEEGKSPDIADLFNEIRNYGVTVESGWGYMSDSQTVEKMDDKLDLFHLLPSHFKRFTSSLNVDCTLLLAMVSDLSHYKSILPSPEHHTAINRQIEIEKEHPLLPVELWPAIHDRELLCTDEAAKRMREIVDTIGTDAEKKRTQILMGDGPFKDLDSGALVQELQDSSNYQIPAQLSLPIKVVDARPVIDSARKEGKLPPIVDNVADILSDINYSVFLYGWVTGIVTISSNRTVVRQIETTVEKYRNGDEDLEGPPVWVCDTPRSLIGKEKDRRE